MKKKGLIGAIVIFFIILIIILGLLYWYFSVNNQDAKLNKGPPEKNSISGQISQNNVCNNNGILDSGEECDDGNLIDNDDCLSTCNLAFCGDGIVWNTENGIEKCDLGVKNSNTVPNSCRSNCVLPRCGDMIIDNNEDCDENNFGTYKNGIEQCSNYSLRYGSGNLHCDACKFSVNNCQEVIRALKFNGINDSLDISINLEKNGVYTFSLWIKPEKSNSVAETIIGCTNNFVSLKILNKAFQFKVINDNDPTIIEKIAKAEGASKGRWHHIVAIHDTSHSKIYLDGYLKHSDPQSGNIEDDVTCVIASDFDSKSGFLKASIDDLRIYNRVLNSKEILEIYTDGQNANSVNESLIGQWKFDDGSGIRAKESSGRGKDGSLIGNPQWVIEELI